MILGRNRGIPCHQIENFKTSKSERKSYQKELYHHQRHHKRKQNIQLGPRPFYLVNDIDRVA